MRALVRIFLLGLAVWAIPFALASAIFTVVPPGTALFESIMAVTLALVACGFGYLHLSRYAAPDMDEGLFAGSMWMLMSIALDLPFFVFGPEQMRMDPAHYMENIAFSYLMLPIIAGAIGHAMRRN
jgi:hypothetical protein